MRTNRIFGMLVLLSVFLGISSCDGPNAPLSLQVFFPYTSNSLLLHQKIQSYTMRFSGSSLESKEAVENPFDPSQDAVELPVLKCDTTKTSNSSDFLEIELLAKNADGDTIATAKQILFQPCGTKQELPLFLTPTHSFSALSHLNNKEATPSEMLSARVGHQISYLPNGKLLISGGAVMTNAGSFQKIITETEIYDPVSGRFTKGPEMSSARAFHTALYLDKKVILLGGIYLEQQSSGAFVLSTSNSIDIFELDSNGNLKKTKSTQLQESKALFSTVVTPQGNLFLFGGIHVQNSSFQLATQWEIISPLGESVSRGQIPENYRRAWHTSAAQSSDNIVVAGGLSLIQDKYQALDSVLSISLKDNDTLVTYKDLPTLQQARAAHTMVSLPDNKGFLVIGGMVPDTSNFFLPKNVFKSVELLNENGDVQKSLQFDLSQPHVFHSSLRLPDQSILVYGGLQAAELMASRSEKIVLDSSWKASTESFAQTKDRFHCAGIVMPNGFFLAIGGATLDLTDNKYIALSRGEVFNPFQ